MSALRWQQSPAMMRRLAIAGGFSLQVLVSGLLIQAYGAYFVALRDEFAWSASALSIAYGMMRVESAVLGPIQGRIIDRIGARRTTAVGVVCMAAGLLLLSHVASLMAFFAVVALAAIGAGLCGLFTMSVGVVQAFSERRSSALGAMWVGFSVGGLLVTPLAWSFEAVGWRETARFSALAMLVIGLPLTRLLPRRRAAIDPAQAESQPERLGGSTPREALRSQSFWLMAAGHGLALLAVGGLIVHLVPYVNEGLGFSLASAGIVVATMNIGQFVGNVGASALGERVDRRSMVVFAMLGHSIGVGCLLVGRSMLLLCAGAVVHGVAWGLRGPLLQLLRADVFGESHYGEVSGYMTLVTQVGMISGPILLGMTQDVAGSWTPGLFGIAVACLVGAACFVKLAIPGRPND